MEFEEVMSEPVSPTGQYFNSSVLSICILGVLESGSPIDDSMAMVLLKNVFLPINPRFSSVMIRDKDGTKRWKRVEVKHKDHVKVPVFPAGLSLESYDRCFRDYLSKIACEQLPQSRPLWEIHIIKYPTSNAAGNLIFKLHHALGDGFSLMGALLSCLQRADNQSLSLTFPSLQVSKKPCQENYSFFLKVPKMVHSLFNTISDFGWSLMKSGCLEDDRSMIRSGGDGVEFKPITISTINFSLDQIKQIKRSLGMTINDVIAGVIFLGTRLYVQTMNNHKRKNENLTALVLLNTRNINGYKSVEEMVKPDADSSWGNRFAFMHVSVPELRALGLSNPLEFVWQANKVISRKKNSMAVSLTGRLLEIVRRFRGPEATARYIHSTLKNSTMTISNIIGPVEPMALANHPVKGLYFMVVGVPQSLTITMLSYTKNLRIAVGAEKGFIDSQKFSSSLEKAFEIISKAAKETPSTTRSKQQS